MSEIVKKPFNTLNRRFKPGMEVSEADVAPLDLADLKERGFVGSPEPSTMSWAASESEARD